MSPESPVQHGVVEKTLDLWSHGKQPWSEFESADIRPNLVDNAAAPEGPRLCTLRCKEVSGNVFRKDTDFKNKKKIILGKIVSVCQLESVVYT